MLWSKVYCKKTTYFLLVHLISLLISLTTMDCMQGLTSFLGRTNPAESKETLLTLAFWGLCLAFFTSGTESWLLRLCSRFETSCFSLFLLCPCFDTSCFSLPWLCSCFLQTCFTQALLCTCLATAESRENFFLILFALSSFSLPCTHWGGIRNW